MRVISARREYRRGPDRLGAELGVAPRTVSRILRRHQMPRLAEGDPLTGALIRASKTTVRCGLTSGFSTSSTISP